MTLQVRPANEASEDDLRAVFGERGDAHACQCQRYRLPRGEAYLHTTPEIRRERLCEQTACGDPGSPATTGLVAYADGEAVGWCAVAPRASYDGLVRNANQTAWRGRGEDRADPDVWAVACVLVRKDRRGEGISRALAAAAVDFARERGARALEAYPVTVRGLVWGEDHPGHESIYAAAGMTAVHRPSKRRAVYRIELAED